MDMVYGFENAKEECTRCYLCDRLESKCICWKPDQSQICDCIPCSKCKLCLYSDEETTCSIRCQCIKDRDWTMCQIEEYCGNRDVSKLIANMAGSPVINSHCKYCGKMWKNCKCGFYGRCKYIIKDLGSDEIY